MSMLIAESGTARLTTFFGAQEGMKGTSPGPGPCFIKLVINEKLQ